MPRFKLLPYCSQSPEEVSLDSSFLHSSNGCNFEQIHIFDKAKEKNSTLSFRQGFCCTPNSLYFLVDYSGRLWRALVGS
jgi:hypothetical protein